MAQSAGSSIAPTPTPQRFREDINGLRGWAVVAVLFYHFNLPGFSGGFIGVDLFFVISGYLMTLIVLRGLEQQRFSLPLFYLSRLRRILPALAVLIIVLFALGWFWLSSYDYQQLGKESRFAATFLSNLYYWKDSGYFAAASLERWLLHSWTLGVEFQFYLFYPLLLILAWRWRPHARSLLRVLLIVALCSFIANLFFINYRQVASFYLLPTRLWEFLAGGIALLVTREKPQLQQKGKILLIAAVVCWLVALFLYDQNNLWPSAGTLLPILTASLLIIAQQERSILTVNPLLRWLGSRSYSLYLWHWPTMVALHFVDLHQNRTAQLIGILVSLLLADLSYRFVETPTRLHLQKLLPRRQFFLFGGTVLALLAFSSLISHSELLHRHQLPPEIATAVAERTNTDPREQECLPQNNISPRCIYGSSDSVGAIVIGDSHALATIGSVAQAASENNLSVLHLAKAGCLPLVTDNSILSRDCAEYNAQLLKQLDDELPQTPAVLIARSAVYLLQHLEQREPFSFSLISSQASSDQLQRRLEEFQNSYTKTICRIARNRPLYLVRPFPEMERAVPTSIERHYLLGQPVVDSKIKLSDYHRSNQQIWAVQENAAKACGATILDPLPYLCDSLYCYGSKNLRPFYKDADHLSETGNRLLLPLFRELF